MSDVKCSIKISMRSLHSVGFKSLILNGMAKIINRIFKGYDYYVRPSISSVREDGGRKRTSLLQKVLTVLTAWTRYFSSQTSLRSKTFKIVYLSVFVLLYDTCCNDWLSVMETWKLYIRLPPKRINFGCEMILAWGYTEVVIYIPTLFTKRAK